MIRQKSHLTINLSYFASYLSSWDLQYSHRLIHLNSSSFFFPYYFIPNAVAFSGLGFLSLYLAGKLHCFQTQGRSQGWKLCAALAPVACALALALTRYSDYRHHWQGTLVLTTTVFFQFDASTQMNNSIGSWLERSLSCIRSLPHVVPNNFVALTESVEVGCPRHPGATTIGSQLQDGDRSVGWQNLTTQP